MPKRKGRGKPKGSSVQKKVKESADSGLDFHDNQSNVLNVDPGFEEVQEADIGMPNKRGRGRPKGSGVQNCQERVRGNLNSDNIPSNMEEAGPGCEESENAGMPKRRGRGRPKGSGVQNCQESVHGNLNSDNIPSNMVEVSSEGDELEELGPKGSTTQKNRQQNTDDTNVTPTRMERGPTRGLTLQMKRQQSADGKLDVLIHPTKLVAVGPGRQDFITDLSIIVRQHARLNVYRWRKVPKSTRDTIVQNVLNNWRLPDTDMVRKAILYEAGRLYRNWRSRLHDYYLLFETKEEALKHVPDDVDASDWQFMVDYFSSPSFEIMSTINKANRAKLRTNHTCGQKSYSAVSYDARDPETGKEPDLQTLWQLTHKRANGEWVDEASKEVNDKVAEQIDEKLRELEESEEGMETIEPEIINNAFETVVGKKYMQGSGAGLRSSSSNIVQQLQAELEAQKRETENARKECNEIRAKLLEVESQLDKEQRKREELEARLVDRQKDMQDINSQVQTAIQSALRQYRPPQLKKKPHQGRKDRFAAFEAQHHEAEDVITDLTSEFGRHVKR